MAASSKRRGDCSVCRHANRAQIEDQRGAGVSFDALADRWGIPKSTVARHWWRHVLPERKASYALGPSTLAEARERAAKESSSVIENLAIVRSTLMRQLLRQDEADAPFGVAAVAAKLLAVLCEMGRITGEIVRDTAPGVVVNNNFGPAPGFSELMAGLVEISRNHPTARADILALVDGLTGSISRAPHVVATIEHHPHA